MCFRNPCLLILKISLRATCYDRASLWKNSLNPPVTEVSSPSLCSPRGWAVWEQLPLERAFLTPHTLCFGSSLLWCESRGWCWLEQQLLWACWATCARAGTQHHALHRQSHQGLSAAAAGLDVQGAINQPQGFLLNKEIFPLPKIPAWQSGSDC